MNIEPELHRSKIEAILHRVRLEDCEVLIVDSPEEWARQHGVKRDLPFVSAIAGLVDGRPVVVLQRKITSDTQSRVLDGMVVRGVELEGFPAEVETLEDPSAYLEHLVLHEAAHLILPDGATELQCDQWAFERMSV